MLSRPLSHRYGLNCNRKCLENISLLLQCFWIHLKPKFHFDCNRKGTKSNPKLLWAGPDQQSKDKTAIAMESAQKAFHCFSNGLQIIRAQMWLQLQQKVSGKHSDTSPLLSEPLEGEVPLCSQPKGHRKQYKASLNWSGPMRHRLGLELAWKALKVHRKNPEAIPNLSWPIGHRLGLGWTWTALKVHKSIPKLLWTCLEQYWAWNWLGKHSKCTERIPKVLQT